MNGWGENRREPETHRLQALFFKQSSNICFKKVSMDGEGGLECELLGGITTELIMQFIMLSKISKMGVGHYKGPDFLKIV